MAEKGKVVAVADDKATVELEAHAGCRHCGLCRSSGSGKMLMEVEGRPDLLPGQRVAVDGGQKSWAASILLLLVPMLFLLGGIALGRVAPISGLSKDACSAIYGVGLLALSFSGGIAWERRQRVRGPAEKPRVVMILDSPAHSC